MIPTTLCVITEENHFVALTESLRDYEYDFAHGLMTGYLLLAVYLEDMAYATAMRNIHGKNGLKHGYCMVMIDGWN